MPGRNTHHRRALLVHEHRGHGAGDPHDEPGTGNLAKQGHRSQHCEDDGQRIGEILLDVVGILDHHADDETAEDLQRNHEPDQRVEALVKAASSDSPACNRMGD